MGVLYDARSATDTARRHRAHGAGVRVHDLCVHEVRVGMAGRDDVAVLVRDAATPTMIQDDGVSSHVVDFETREGEGRDVVVPDEPKLVRVAPRRLAAYLAGRYCASRALHVARWTGDSRVPIGEAGGPAWPTGVVGSISHAPTRAVAVVGSSARWRGLGVDCERVLDDGEADEFVCSVMPEADGVAVTGADTISWAEFVTVGFSAKESLYKSLRPIVGEFFDFADARLTRLDRTAHTARLRLTRTLGGGDALATFGEGRAFDVAFAVVDGHVYTYVAVPAVAGPSGPEIAA